MTYALRGDRMFTLHVVEGGEGLKSVSIISLMTEWPEGVLEGKKREEWKTSEETHRAIQEEVLMT